MLLSLLFRQDGDWSDYAADNDKWSCSRDHRQSHCCSLKVVWLNRLKSLVNYLHNYSAQDRLQSLIWDFFFGLTTQCGKPWCSSAHMGERDVRDEIIYSHMHFCPFVLEKLALEVAFLVCATCLLVWGPILVAFSMSLLNPKPNFGKTVPS